MTVNTVNNTSMVDQIFKSVRGLVHRGFCCITKILLIHVHFPAT